MEIMREVLSVSRKYTTVALKCGYRHSQAFDGAAPRKGDRIVDRACTEMQARDAAHREESARQAAYGRCTHSRPIVDARYGKTTIGCGAFVIDGRCVYGH